MKNYLKCTLSQEEKDLITAIIWVTAKNYKKRLFKRNRHQLIPIDDVEISVEDEYEFVKFETRSDFDFTRPIAMSNRVRIVEYIDRILSELSLNKFKVALTFDEKLVLFLYCFKKFTEEKVATLMGVSRRTIIRKNKSIENKKIMYLGGLWNVQ